MKKVIRIYIWFPQWTLYATNDTTFSEKRTNVWGSKTQYVYKSPWSLLPGYERVVIGSIAGTYDPTVPEIVVFSSDTTHSVVTVQESVQALSVRLISISCLTV